ncbi:MAG: hypothetical protein ACJ8J7_07970 [Sulfurifustaceae bacterium]
MHEVLGYLGNIVFVPLELQLTRPATDPSVDVRDRLCAVVRTHVRNAGVTAGAMILVEQLASRRRLCWRIL